MKRSRLIREGMDVKVAEIYILFEDGKDQLNVTREKQKMKEAAEGKLTTGKFDLF